MEITAALAADLGLLTAALDGSDNDLAMSLRRLVADAKLVVSSYAGLTVTINGGGRDYDLTAPEHAMPGAGDIRASIEVPLHLVDGGSEPAASMILYATHAGAFVDLAADLSWLTGRDLGEFVLDQHLSMPAEAVGADSLRGAATINQAVGVLIGWGHSLDAAHRELDALALVAGTDRHAAAVAILDALVPSGTVDETFT